MQIALQQALKTGVAAARASGALMRRHFHRPKKVNEEIQHDIKLELDVRSQKLIERTLLKSFPRASVLGEEGTVGELGAAYRWVVDPIDGTVNFAYGIPHACVSIALQRRVVGAEDAPVDQSGSDFETVLGVVYDPFCDELWTATRSGRARLNGRGIKVSTRARLREAIVTMGFAKYKWSLNATLPLFEVLIHRVRKVRIMGSAALALTYVASGRLDAYLEGGIRLWDIAAGGLILERAGGEFWHRPLEGRPFSYELNANNGRIRRHIQNLAQRTATQKSR
ncbi:MAG TPA: inositol monophosphatase [Verrucomicrobiales bacterium]|nr:inositol monophosphatase [Verrucomicrobiales bacterium]